VAEDESLIRIDVVETLRDHGFDVIAEAADGEKAVALAEELRPDLVVMDVKMPLLDGISAADIITKKKIAPVVLLTAFRNVSLSRGQQKRELWPMSSNLLRPTTSFLQLILLSAATNSSRHWKTKCQI